MCDMYSYPRNARYYRRWGSKEVDTCLFPMHPVSLPIRGDIMAAGFVTSMIETERCQALLDRFREHLPENRDDCLAYLAGWYDDYRHSRCFQQILAEMGTVLLSKTTTGDVTAFIDRLRDPFPIMAFLLEEAGDTLHARDIPRTAQILAGILPAAEQVLAAAEPHHPLAFRDFIEYALYSRSVPDTGRPVIPYLPVDILLHHALLLRKMGDVSEAYRIISRLTDISPVNASLYHEQAGLELILNRDAEMRVHLREAFRCSWTEGDLAASYRDYAALLARDGDMEGAVACFLMGETWDPDPAGRHDLEILVQETGITVDRDWYNANGERILAERGIPFGPDREIVELMIAYADECLEENDLNEARKYLVLAKALTYDERLEQRLSLVEGMLEERTMF